MSDSILSLPAKSVKAPPRPCPKMVEGIFMSSRGCSVPSAAPGIPSGTFSNLDFPALNDQGDVAFLATVRRGRETVEAIYVQARGRLRKVVAQEDSPPAGGTFLALGVPALNNAGIVAFGAVVEGRGVPGGVFTAAGDRLRMLAGAGDATPLGGIFAKFSERVSINDGGTVAFYRLLKDAPVRSVIFLGGGDRPGKVVALGDPAPAGGVFSNFGFWPALSAAGAVTFTAVIRRCRVGVRACAPGGRHAACEGRAAQRQHVAHPVEFGLEGQTIHPPSGGS